MEKEIVVGVDVAKDHLDVYWHPSGERLTVPNSIAGHREIAQRLASDEAKLWSQFGVADGTGLLAKGA